MKTNNKYSFSNDDTEPSCPLCKSCNVHFFHTHPTVNQQLWHCKECKFYFAFPHEPYVHSNHEEVEKDAIDGYWSNAKAINYYKNWREEENRRLADWTLKRIMPGRVLEIGVGDGPLTQYISGHTTDYWGIEPDTNAIERARKLMPDIAHKLHVLRSDELDESEIFSLMKGSFDSIFLFSVLEHIAQPVSFFNTASTLLKPGGRLIISVPNSNKFFIFYLLRRISGIEPWTYFHISFFNFDNLKQALKANKFNIIETQQYTLLTDNSINYFSSRYNSRLLALLMKSFKWLQLDKILGMTTYFICYEKIEYEDR